MDKNTECIYNRYKDEILAHAASAFGLSKDNFRKIGPFETIVYGCSRKGKEYILKFNHSTHRTRNQVRAELDWVNYLADNGVNVVRNIPALNGEPFITFDLKDDRDGYFSVIAFHKAPGGYLKAEDWDDNLYFKWGEATGQIHALSKEYTPRGEYYKRPAWDDDGFMNWEHFDPDSHQNPEVIMECQDLISRLRQLERDDDSFGLIHCDLHHWNFFWYNGDIHIFDTDDSRYDWYVNDVAIPLIYSLFEPGVADNHETHARRFLRAFMDGYRRFDDIPEAWMRRIPLFMKLRELDLYLILLQEAPDTYNGWCRNFLHERRERIGRKLPVVKQDFDEFIT